jgi:hypothetical protein
VPDIRIIVEPSVYLVGSGEVHEAELARFLADEGVAGWSTGYSPFTA